MQTSANISAFEKKLAQESFLYLPKFLNIFTNVVKYDSRNGRRNSKNQENLLKLQNTPKSWLTSDCMLQKKQNVKSNFLKRDIFLHLAVIFLDKKKKQILGVCTALRTMTNPLYASIGLRAIADPDYGWFGDLFRTKIN